MAFVDPHKFKQVIRNLVSNALKFTPKQGCVTVSISFVSTGEVGAVEGVDGNGIVIIDVTDTGAGISKVLYVCFVCLI